MRMGKLPHTVHFRHAQLQRYKQSVGLCSSGSIMTYPDDKSMTKLERNVHGPVMQTGYTLAMAIVSEDEIGIAQYIQQVILPIIMTCTLEENEYDEEIRIIVCDTESCSSPPGCLWWQCW